MRASVAVVRARLTAPFKETILASYRWFVPLLFGLVPIISIAATTADYGWSGSATRTGGELNILPTQSFSANSASGDPALTYTAGSASDNTWASFRSGYGSIGVLASSILVQTIPAPPRPFAHYLGTAEAQASSHDIITISSSDMAFGTIVPVNVMATLDYTYTSMESTDPTQGNPGAFPTAILYYSYTASIYRNIGGSMILVLPPITVDRCFAVIAGGSSCLTPNFVGDPSFHQARDEFGYASQLMVGDVIDMSISLTARVRGDLYNSTTLPFTGSVEASIQAMNSLHSYFSSSNASIDFLGASGYDYALPVPESSTCMMIIMGLIAISITRMKRS